MTGKNTEIDLGGYNGRIKDKLTRDGINVWSIVKITRRDGAEFTGLLLPRSEHTSNDYISLKTGDTGYNIGVFLPDDAIIEEIGYRKGIYKIPEIEVSIKEHLPNVSLIGTGGTVASRLDYRTGAVLPAFTPQELFAAVPELMDIANVIPKTLFEILSENFVPEYWVKTAEAVKKDIESGVDGVIIGHGTDTMSYTGSALSFMLKNLHVPVVLVGSQRSSDRPSSDGPMNIMSASYIAGHADLSEVVVCMHGETSDNYNLIHRATRVRKMHSSRRDAFRTLSDIPLGRIDALTHKITMLKNDYRRRSSGEDFYLDAKIDDKVAMLYSYPGMKAEVIDSLIDKDYHGIVIIGTGLGHVSKNVYPALDRAKEEEIPIVITVQPLFGFTHLRVYETGRDMLAKGVIELGNMIPGTAYAKLIWVLGHTREIKEVKKIMQTNLAGEITTREPDKGYSLDPGI
ncbi:MAG: Glu-tRNA(Gln) amidotransferase subunit GatD [Candidatus Hodarchaeales archaeon]|jgi:glutamyl-tRNA(Gln) amidotransferase subunit D